MALIGDNPGGKEVVSPLDGLLDMIKVATAESGGGNITIQNIIELDGEEVYRNVKIRSWEEFDRSGESPFPAY